MNEDLLKRLADLTPAQRAALLAQLRRAPEGVPAHPFQRHHAPLSSSQQRMLFAEYLDPAAQALHTISGVVRVPAPLDADRMRAGLAALVQRHEILRTTFHLVDGVFEGRVHETGTIPVEVATAVADRALLEGQLRLNAQRSFDPASGPLAHVWLHDDGVAGFTMQLTMSHLVSDGYSNRVLFEELATLYGLNGDLTLQPLPAQFADYAHHATTSDAVAERLAWWADRLAGAPAASVLPFDHAPAALPDQRAARRPLHLSDAQYAKLRAAAASWGTTPFVVLLATLAIVVARWSDQDDLVIGAPVANRGAPGSTRLIGPFLNTVALRGQLDAGLTFGQVVARWRQIALDSLDRQDVPLERVVEAVAPERAVGLPPLCQTLLNVQADLAGTSDLEGLSMDEVPSGSTECPLSMTWVLGEHAVGHLDHWVHGYDEPTIDAFVDAFLRVLTGGLDAPATPWTHLSLTGESLTASLLRGEDVPRVLDVDGAPLLPVQWFLRDAQADPSWEAVVDADRRLSAGDVAAASASVAELLRRAGVVPGDRVVLALPRSADLVVSAVAAARLGATFVPVDVAQPRARLQAILEDCRPSAVVTAPGVADLPEPDGWVSLRWSFDALEPADPWQPATASEAMYMIYTSGSTGTPKGVLVSSTTVNNMLCVVPHLYRLRNGLRVIGAVSPAFDMSIFDVWVPLTRRGTMVLATDDEAHDPTLLADLLARERIDVALVAPATLQGLKNIGWGGAPGLLTISGGDVFPPPLAAYLLDRVGQLWNAYGPTENTVYSHSHRMTADDLDASIPIGRPIGNNTNLVLDAGGHPVPVGVPGELWIGGESVALGYHDRPELTTERFVDLGPGVGRCYRTGDKVTLGADGELRFIGRIDHQVKIRGYRIELGEVEAALLAAPGVLDAAALVVGDDQDKRIVAHVVTGPGYDEPAVLDHAATRLPGYMVPRQVVVRQSLPRSVAGKVDRRALAAEPLTSVAPAPEGTRARREPTSDLERDLLAIWREVLSTPDLGMDDDFFRVGGHSILATQLLFRVKQAFGVDVPLQLLFSREATAAEMAGFLAEAAEGEGTDRALELDLGAEAVLDPAIRPEPGVHTHSGRNPQHPLVTGITGFIGTFLAARLLEAGAPVVFGLVRAAGRRDGLARIRASFEHYRLWRDEYAERIIPVVGDLAKPRLGLDRPTWEHLAVVVDSIYHSGADVNFVRPYATLKAPNVLGTAEVLRLAGTFAIKPVHYMSTIYVYDRFTHEPDTFYTEDLPPLQGLEHTFGYSQSKWVAERLVEQAQERGLPATIFRLGRVSGAVDTGISPSYDLLWRSAQVGVAIKAVPVVPMAVDMTPVDWVADAIVHISRKPGLHGRAFHVLNPTVLQERTFVEMSETYGYDVEHVTFAQWRDRVVAQASDLTDETAGALAPFLTGAMPLDDWPEGDIDTRNVREALADTDIACHPIDEDLVAAYYDHFVSTGFMPSPHTTNREEIKA